MRNALITTSEWIRGALKKQYEDQLTKVTEQELEEANAQGNEEQVNSNS